jgi:hypothetical protein
VLELDKNRADVPLGHFEFGQSYLENPQAVPIDPGELKLSEMTYETGQLNGVFGHGATPEGIFGDAASLKSMPANRCWARWTIFSNRPTIVPARPVVG